MEEKNLPFDPDFDLAAEPVSPVASDPTQNVFDVLGARGAFLIGFALSLLFLMSVGFVVLLSLLLANGSLSLS